MILKCFQFWGIYKAHFTFIFYFVLNIMFGPFPGSNNTHNTTVYYLRITKLKIN